MNDTQTKRIHSFRDEFVAVNRSARKLAALLRHLDIDYQATDIVSCDIVGELEAYRPLWLEGRLVADQCNYFSASTSSTAASIFARKLRLYADRLVELIDEEINNTDMNILVWLQVNYGEEETAALQATQLCQRPAEEQLRLWKHFLEWFRSIFPYYHDRCQHCQASWKDDPVVVVEGPDNLPLEDADEQHGSFVGYVYPNEHERQGRAARTELYCCHLCHQTTRFPRYNAASYTINDRRGRCGEYSVLLYVMLRCLGHEARWVIDWADHVWNEVRVDNRWVHLDPCEAAVDEPLLYQGWGKKATYVIAYFAPKPEDLGQEPHYPLIQDVTLVYTEDSVDEIEQRRTEGSGSSVDEMIVEATELLWARLISLAHDEE